MVATILREQGAHAVVAGSAAEALHEVEQARPDVLVSDIGMPEEDGYALLRRVRAFAAVPALALTAYAGPEDARMAALAGFERYLAKPVVPPRLIDEVARLAGRG
jgi:CheY-like chemotaxis protein